MKKFSSFLLPVCIALSGIFTGCKQELNPTIHIIQIEGVSWASNVTTSAGMISSTPEIEGQDEVTLSASDGDLLYMMNSDDLQLYYRYNSKDGQNLEVSFDTLQAVKVYLNGKLNYMELSKSNSNEEFEALSDPEISQLSTLNINGVLNKHLISNLEKHKSQLQGLGLVLENASGAIDLSNLLDICRPELLVLDDSWQLPEPGDNNIFENLELLWIYEYVPTLEKAIGGCQNLESLIIYGWEPNPGELLSLSSLKKLKRGI